MLKDNMDKRWQMLEHLAAVGKGLSEPMDKQNSVNIKSRGSVKIYSLRKHKQTKI